MEKDYYKILEVEEKADEKQIKDAFRKLALRYHPDRNRDNPEASAVMKDINEAYAVLSDPMKRKQYDSLKQAYGSDAYEHFKQSYTEHDIFRGSDINQILNDLSRAFGFRNFDEIFKEFYGAGSGAFEFKNNSGGGKGFIYSYGPDSVSRSDSFLSGRLAKLFKYGLKKIFGVELPERGKDIRDGITLPLELAASGGRIKYSSKKVSKELLVKIPPGIKEGQHIRLKGLGKKGKGSGEPGDLLVKIRVRKPLFYRIAALFRKSKR